MSLLVFVIVAFAFAGLAAVLRGGRGLADGGRPGRAVAAVIAALAIDPAQVVDIRGGGIATTAYLRLFLVLGSLVGLGLAVSGLAGGSRRDAPAVTLAILGACGLTLGLVDARAAVLVATAGGLFGVLVTLIPGSGRVGRDDRHPRDPGGHRRRGAGHRRDGLVRPRPEPARRPAGRLRSRLPRLRRGGRDALRGHPVPPLGGPPDRRRARDGPADPDRDGPGVAGDRRPRLDRRVGHAAAGRPRLGARCSCSPSPSPRSSSRPIAAFVQDDLEHVLGYSIIGDAGVVMLALATLDPEAWAPARIWILVVRRDPQRIRGVGARASGPASGPGASPTCAAGSGGRRSWPPPSRWSSSRPSGTRGWSSFDARKAIVDLALDAPARDDRADRDARCRWPTTGGCW